MQQCEPRETGLVIYPLQTSGLKSFREELKKPWPLSLDVLRKPLVEKLNEFEVKAQDYTARAQALMQGPAFFSNDPPHWEITQEEVDSLSESVGEMIEESKSLSYRPPIVETLYKYESVVEFVLLARSSLDTEAPLMITSTDLVKLVPREGSTTLGKAATSPTAERAKGLNRFLLQLDKSYKEWRAAVRPVVENRGSDKVIMTAEELRGHVERYHTIKVLDAAGLHEKLQAVLGKAEEWEEKARQCLESRSYADCNPLIEEASATLGRVELKGLDDLRKMEEEVGWLEGAKTALGASRVKIDTLTRLLNDPRRHNKDAAVGEEVEAAVKGLEDLMAEASDLHSEATTLLKQAAPDLGELKSCLVKLQASRLDLPEERAIGIAMEVMEMDKAVDVSAEDIKSLVERARGTGHEQMVDGLKGRLTIAQNLEGKGQETLGKLSGAKTQEEYDKEVAHYRILADEAVKARLAIASLAQAAGIIDTISTWHQKMNALLMDAEGWQDLDALQRAFSQQMKESKKMRLPAFLRNLVTKAEELVSFSMEARATAAKLVSSDGKGGDLQVIQDLLKRGDQLEQSSFKCNWQAACLEALAILREMEWRLVLETLLRHRASLVGLQNHANSPKAPQEHPSVSESKGLIQRATVLEQGCQDTIKNILAGDTLEEAIKARLEELFGSFLGKDVRFETGVGLAASAASHFGTEPCIESTPGALLNTAQQMSLLEIMQKNLGELSVSLQSLQTARECHDELDWYQKAVFLLMTGVRPTLGALVSLKDGGSGWTHNWVQGAGFTKVRQRVDTLVNCAEECNAKLKGVLVVRPMSKSGKGQQQEALPTVAQLKGLLADPLLTEVELDGETALRNLITQAEQQLAQAKAILSGGAAETEAKDVTTLFGKRMDKEAANAAARQVRQIVQTCKVPVAMPEVKALEWLSKLLSWFDRTLEFLDVDSSVDDVDLSKTAWKDINEGVLLSTDAKGVIHPAIPPEIHEALDQAGITISCPDLEALPAALPRSEMTGDPVILADSPVFTFMVSGTNNAFLLQALKLYVRVRSRVHRVRQCRKSIKDLEAAVMSNQATLEPEVVAFLQGMQKALGIGKKKASEPPTPRGTGADGNPLKRRLSEDGSVDLSKTDSKKAHLQDDSSATSSTKAGKKTVKVVNETGVKREKADHITDAQMPRKKLKPITPGESASAGPTTPKTPSESNANACLNPNCFWRAPAGSHYCGEPCTLAASEHLHTALVDLKKALDIVWIYKHMEGTVPVDKLPPAVSNLIKHHPELLSSEVLRADSIESLFFGKQRNIPPPTLAAAASLSSFSSSISKLGGKASGACGDVIRDRVRNALKETFMKGMSRIGVKPLQILAITFGMDLEYELFRLHGSEKDAYTKKYRSLKYNLDDVKNPQLMKRIVNREISMQDLCNMSADELASQEVKEGQMKALEEQKKKLFVKENEEEFVMVRTKDGMVMVSKTGRRQDDVTIPTKPPPDVAEELTNGLAAAITTDDNVREEKKLPTPRSVLPTPNSAAGTPREGSQPVTSLDNVMEPLKPPPKFSFNDKVVMETVPELPERKQVVEMDPHVPPGFGMVVPLQHRVMGLNDMHTAFSISQTSGKPFSFRAYAPDGLVNESQNLLREPLVVKGRTRIQELDKYLKQCHSNQRFRVHHLLATEAEDANGEIALASPKSSKDAPITEYRNFCKTLGSAARAAYISVEDSNVQIYFVPPELIPSLSFVTVQGDIAAYFLHIFIIHKKSTGSTKRSHRGGTEPLYDVSQDMSMASSREGNRGGIASPNSYNDDEDLSLSSSNHSRKEEFSPGPTMPILPQPPLVPSTALPPYSRPPPPPPPPTIPTFPTAIPAPPLYPHALPPPQQPPTPPAPPPLAPPPLVPPPRPAPMPAPQAVENLSPQEKETIEKTAQFVASKGPEIMGILKDRVTSGQQRNLEFLFPGKRGHTYFNTVLAALVVQKTQAGIPPQGPALTRPYGGGQQPQPPQQRRNRWNESAATSPPLPNATSPPVAVSPNYYSSPSPHSYDASPHGPPQRRSGAGGGGRGGGGYRPGRR